MRFQISDFRFQIGVALAAAALAVSAVAAQDNTSRLLDETLDLYVRDGLVYYRALRSDRSRLDRYVSAIGGADVAGRPRDEQVAFWINAYNAIVLKTVIDHYPTAQRFEGVSGAQHPADSGRVRAQRAPGRGKERDARSDRAERPGGVRRSARLPALWAAVRSEAAGCGARPIRAQTSSGSSSDVANECATRAQCVEIDKSENEVRVSSIFSWRQKEFAAVYADKAEQTYAARSPIERAVLALVSPQLLTTEREFLEPNQFKVVYPRSTGRSTT